MKKCGKLYDEILKSKSVASRKFDYSYMKTVDVIRKSNLSERRRWVRDLKINTKNDLIPPKPENVYSNPPPEKQSISQKKQDTRNNTNKIKEEIERKSLQKHMKQQKDTNKKGMCVPISFLAKLCQI